MTQPDVASSTKFLGTGLRVLVIDDDEYMRSVVSRLLRRLDVTYIAEAADGASALGAIKAAQPGFDLLICDLDMPGSDGMEFMRLASGLETAAPLLVLSGKGAAVLRSVEIMASEYRLRIVGAVQKPPTIPLLREAPKACASQIGSTPRGAVRAYSADELATALGADQFETFFQPKVSIATGVVTGCEALVRWRHPQHGVLAPGAFIGDIEAHGLMERLTRVVFMKSGRWLQRAREAGLHFPVSINLSMSSFEDVELAARILDMVQIANLVPGDFTIEVTETIAMSNVGRCLESLVRLRLRGFGLSIDDFGTGFSSLQQLEQVPYSELKIDRAFVHGVSNQPRLQAVLESSIDIARKLELKTVAEGVEHAEDFEFLRARGCDIAQGYFISKPLSGGDFLVWAAGQHA